MALPKRELERLLDAADRAANELTGGDHAGSCTCPGCMLDNEVRRFRQPCARKGCGAPRYAHHKPHTFQDPDRVVG